MRYKLAVIGNPIEHSLSPKLFAIFAKQFGLDIEFKKIIATMDTFEEIVADFFVNNGVALAVTSPFKPLAYKFANIISDNASPCLSANFLYLNDGGIIAENTDGIGLVKDITERLNITLSGANLLILGGGGVVSAIIPALMASGVASVNVCVRNRQQLLEIQNKFPQVMEFDSAKQYTGLINTTPNVIENQLLEQQFDLQEFVYDMNYQSEKTLCIQKALQRNLHLRYSNGLGMLVMQAYYSFSILFDLYPDVENAYLNMLQ